MSPVGYIFIPSPTEPGDETVMLPPPPSLDCCKLVPRWITEEREGGQFLQKILTIHVTTGYLVSLIAYLFHQTASPSKKNTYFAEIHFLSYILVYPPPFPLPCRLVIVPRRGYDLGAPLRWLREPLMPDQGYEGGGAFPSERSGKPLLRRQEKGKAWVQVSWKVAKVTKILKIFRFLYRTQY